VGVLPLLGCLASGLGFVVEEADLDGDIVEEERFVFFVRLYARYMFFTKSPETLINNSHLHEAAPTSRCYHLLPDEPCRLAAEASQPRSDGSNHSSCETFKMFFFQAVLCMAFAKANDELVHILKSGRSVCL